MTSYVVDLARKVGSRPRTEDLTRAIGLVRAHLDDVVVLLRSAREEDLADVTARSYRHPNGFAKIVLHDAGPEWTSVRLHVWPTVGAHAVFDGVPRGDTAPHSHRWAFASTLIAGHGLVIDEFSRGAAGEPYERFVFAPGTSAGLRRDGEERLAGRRTRVRQHGDDDVYACGAGHIHTVVPVDERLTATLVFQGPETQSSAKVFRRRNAPPDPGRAPLDGTTTAMLIGDVLVEVEAAVRRSRPGNGAERPEGWGPSHRTLSGC